MKPSACTVGFFLAENIFQFPKSSQISSANTKIAKLVKSMIPQLLQSVCYSNMCRTHANNKVHHCTYQLNGFIQEMQFGNIAHSYNNVKRLSTELFIEFSFRRKF